MAHQGAIQRRIRKASKKDQFGDAGQSATSRSAGLSNARKDNASRPAKQRLKTPFNIKQTRIK